MIELPEATIIASQMSEALAGKQIASAVRGNVPHKFAFYSRPAEEYAAILAGKRMGAAKELGGRATERDLYNRPGGYLRTMDSKRVGQPCSACETPIEKIQYLGGACNLCPNCQV